MFMDELMSLILYLRFMNIYIPWNHIRLYVVYDKCENIEETL